MIKIISIPISQKNYAKTALFVKNKIQKKQKSYICVAAVHLIMEAQKNPKLLAGVQNADLITPDGMPLVWLSKLYGNKNASRVYGPDLTLILCRLAERFNYKVFLLGGNIGQSKQLSKKLREIFPKLKIVGSIDTPIRPIIAKDNQKIIKKINLTKPEIVLVGMGCPNQELWMIENRDKISPPVLIGVGAAFDFITGKVQQAPKWMQNWGLEWFHRLLQNPKRLWRRYTVINIQFLLKIMNQIFLDLFNKKLP
jgi:N-acetylglucosaminyldiphosphoundecaprenol N-acetyl-beta-D-mannosaminyltransferase